jgi:UTP--glucose-1-phosphate uridylyltransferase
MKNNNTTKAVIPSAGLGTRLYPLSKYIPKELFPIGNRSVIELVINEGILSGLRDFLIIISPKKEIIKDYLQDLQKTSNLINDICKVDDKIEFHFIYQDIPSGLGNALMLAKDFTSNEPFCVLLPDNIYPDDPQAIFQLIETFKKYSCPVLGSSTVDESLEDMFEGSGRFEYEILEENEFLIKKIYDKKTVFDADAKNKIFKYRGRGRYVLTSEFYDHIEKMRPDKVADYDEIPALQSMIVEKRIIARVIEGRTFDTGTPRGYIYMLQNLDLDDIK